MTKKSDLAGQMAGLLRESNIEVPDGKRVYTQFDLDDAFVKVGAETVDLIFKRTIESVGDDLQFASSRYIFGLGLGLVSDLASTAYGLTRNFLASDGFKEEGLEGMNMTEYVDSIRSSLKVDIKLGKSGLEGTMVRDDEQNINDNKKKSKKALDEEKLEKK